MPQSNYGRYLVIRITDEGREQLCFRSRTLTTARRLAKLLRAELHLDDDRVIIRDGARHTTK
jgi:hypothetical protein